MSPPAEGRSSGAGRPPENAHADAAGANPGEGTPLVDAVLLVRVAETWLGLDARVVEEVISVEVPSPLPFAPPHLLGVIVHNERVLPLVHAGRLFGLTPAADDGRRDHSFERTIILSTLGMSAGLLCDRAAGVVEVSAAALEPITLMKGQALARFLIGEMDTLRGRCGVVDVDALFDAARIKG